jgi:hypothetical protein
MTDADFILWLKSATRIPCVLVEAVALVDGVETTRYLSNTGYTTSPTDTPASTHYLSCIEDGARITEQLSLDDTGASMAFGDIEIDNTEGNLDDWLADIWVNRQVRMYVGDMRWERSDFRLVFDGITSDLGSRSREVLNLTVRDKLQRLNTAVTETKLGGTSINADRLLPVCLGEVHNVEPLLVDKAALKYQVHDGEIERIIEVRDNGVPVAHTASLSTGTFTLSASPAGTITCSVQGAKLDGTYVNTTAKLVELLATEYGTDPFDSGDLDAANLAAFDTANPQPVGVYLQERENVLALCQQLVASVGGQAVMSADGKLQLIKLAVPVAGTAVTAANMAERSLRVAQRIPVVAAVKLGYCKCWTVQTGLDTGIPADHKALYALEWLTATASNASVAAAYKLTQEPQQQNTLMQVREDAIAETARRLALWREQRTVWTYEGMPELLLEELGAFQTITHARFGFSEGVNAQIVSIERDWLGARAGFSVITGGSGEIDVIVDDAGGEVSARYWRVYITDNNGDSFTGLEKIEMRESVGGPNVCSGLAGSAYTASSSPGSVQNAFDDISGNPPGDDWYTSTPGALPAWVRVDFGSGNSKAISQVLLRSRNSGTSDWGGDQAPKDFAIQYSDNDVSYTPLFSVTNSTGWGSGESRIFSADE